MNNIKRVTAGQRLKMALYLIGAMLLLSVSFVQPTNALTPDEQKACQARYDGKTLNDSEVSDEMFQKCLQRNGGNCTIESGGGGGDGGVLYSVSCTPPTGATTDDSNVNEAGTDTCRIDGIGWIICPVAAFLSQITDGAYALVEKLLVFRIAENAFDTNPATNPTFAIWSNIRNLANVAFVIAFFVVIFSQATSIGLSSYGVRKMLPRIIIAAILVNLSYYICAFAVDLSNIIGAGIDGVIRNVPFGSGGGTPLPIEGDGKWEEITSGLLAGVAGGVALSSLAFAGWGILLPFLAFSFLAIITAIAVLAARHALLIILIILSPLAFVAYILPNTEGLFDKWRKAIIAMLIMYPLVAILFSGSRVAGEIIMMMNEGNGFMSFIMNLVALGVMAFPLFGVPYIVKFSGGLIGRIAGVVNDRGKGLVDRSRNFGKEHDKRARTNFGQNLRDNKFGEKFGTWGKGEDGSEDPGLRGKARRRFGRAFGATATRASRAALWARDRKDSNESSLKMAEARAAEARESRLAGLVNKEEFMEPEKDEKGNVIIGENGKPKMRFNKEALEIEAKKRRAVADSLALKAAGITGQEGAERIKRAAREQSRKRWNDEVDRETGDWISSDLVNHNTIVRELAKDDRGNLIVGSDGRYVTAKRKDANGNLVEKDNLGMHDRLSSIGSGAAIEWEDSRGNLHVVDGASDEKIRAAAYKRIGDTGDKKAATASHLAMDLALQPVRREITIENTQRELRGERHLSEAEVQERFTNRIKEIRESNRPEDLRIADAIKYSVAPGSPDEALLLNYLGSSSTLSPAMPHYRASAGGAFNAPTSEKIYKNTAEEVKFAMGYYESMLGSLETKLEYARQTGNKTMIDNATKALNDKKELVQTYIKNFKYAADNDNMRGAMDDTAIEFVEEYAKNNGYEYISSAEAKKRASNASTPPPQSQPNPQPTPQPQPQPSPAPQPSPTPGPTSKPQSQPNPQPAQQPQPEPNPNINSDVPPGYTVSDGGLFVPHERHRPSANPTSSQTQPPVFYMVNEPGEPTLQQQRAQGGNFNGFNTAPTPPSTTNPDNTPPPDNRTNP